MIRLDLSKAIPLRAYVFLLPLIPGLFFEISISLANPELVHHLVEASAKGFAPGYYTRLAVAVILALMIGNASGLFVVLTQNFLKYVYRLAAFLWRRFNEKLMRPPAKQSRGGSRWLLQLHRYAQTRDHRFSAGLMEVQRSRRFVTEELLRRGYGLDMERGRRLDWGIWYALLPRKTAEMRRGDVVVVAIHAAGWCGIAATYFALPLRNPWYMGFAGIQILFGILHDWSLAKRQSNPIWDGVSKIGSTLAELRELEARKIDAESAAHKPHGG